MAATSWQIPKHLHYQFQSHAQKVCSLYKRALENLRSEHHMDRLEYRYHAVMMRARFDLHKNEKDLIRAKQMLEDGEKELYDNMYYDQWKFVNDPGGAAFQRYVYPPDSIVDGWHPLEKAQYPEYFARREQRKREYAQRYEAKYGKPTDDEHH